MKVSRWKLFLFLQLALCAAVMSFTGAMAGEKGEVKDDVESTVLEGQLAPRLQDLGKHTFPVTTDSDRAQLFINQAVNLLYGFNHKEAERSFREAARLDPECAMAYWGMALVLGPNINLPMSPDDEPVAYELVQKALSLKGGTSTREQGLIDALAKRYSGEVQADRSINDRAYAEAMAQLYRQFPEDLDIATLYAEALMDLRPWNYWTRDGRPYAETSEVMAVLESVIEKNPKHPGAIHLYIHTVEYARPELAEAGADRLRQLVPGAGHLVHMPSHIYRRIGRYHDASISNVAAIAADEDYITQCRAQGIYPLAYYPHNIHFLWDSATMEGRRQLAIDAAQKAAATIPDGLWREIPLLHQFLVAPLFAYTRFGEWDRILAEPKPPEDSAFWTAVWHYARGLAYTAKNDLKSAEQEHRALSQLGSREGMADYRVTFSRNNAKAILDIAELVLAGEIAARGGDYGLAVSLLHQGALREDNLIYNEPPDWHVPVRQVLGAVLLDADRAAEAEAVYWQDLQRNRENGWGLYGLMRSLQAQGREEDAAAVEQRFRKAWANADMELKASRLMN